MGFFLSEWVFPREFLKDDFADFFFTKRPILADIPEMYTCTQAFARIFACAVKIETRPAHKSQDAFARGCDFTAFD